MAQEYKSRFNPKREKDSQNTNTGVSKGESSGEKGLKELKFPTKQEAKKKKIDVRVSEM